MEELLKSIAGAKDVQTLALLMLTLFIVATAFLFRFFTKEATRKEAENRAEHQRREEAYLTAIQEMHEKQIAAYETFTSRLMQTQAAFLKELREIETVNKQHFSELKASIEEISTLLPKRSSDLPR